MSECISSIMFDQFGDLVVREATDGQEVLVAGAGDQGEDGGGSLGAGEASDLPHLVGHGQVLFLPPGGGEAAHDAG